MKEKPREISPHVVADAYSSKNNFATGLKEMGLHLISRFRDDAVLFYPNFNASLTTVNLTKVLAKEKGIPFSMASCKTIIHNAYLLERFIRVSGIRPNRRLNDKLVKEIVEFAAIAA